MNDRIKEEKEAKEKEQLARKAAEEKAKKAEEIARKAEEEARKVEEEKIFLNIETLVEFGIKGKEIEQRLSSKLGMSAEQAKDWIRNTQNTKHQEAPRFREPLLIERS